MAKFRGRRKHMEYAYRLRGHDKRSARHREAAKHEQKVAALVKRLKAEAAQNEGAAQ